MDARWATIAVLLIISGQFCNARGSPSFGAVRRRLQQQTGGSSGTAPRTIPPLEARSGSCFGPCKPVGSSSASAPAAPAPWNNKPGEADPGRAAQCRATFDTTMRAINSRIFKEQNSKCAAFKTAEEQKACVRQLSQEGDAALKEHQSNLQSCLARARD